jgi:hypothetical protein
MLLYDADLLARLFWPAGTGGLDPLHRSAGRLWRAAVVVLLLAALGVGRVQSEVDSPAATDARERNNYFRALGEFVRMHTRKGATILVWNGDNEELRALGWYGRRNTVEFADYSLAWTLSHPGPRGLFLLGTSGRGEGRSTNADVPGFALLSTWNAGSGDSASLYRWQGARR